jgi:ferritin-like metal-binding protein YciE
VPFVTQSLIFHTGKEGKVMPKTGTLHDAFVDELRDVYDAERQLMNALPKMANAASSAKLRAAFEAHLQETREHVARLESIFESLDEQVRGKHCEGVAGIIEEGKSAMEEDFNDATMDACLIAGGQRAEHYEMAAYGTLISWARVMGQNDAADLLERTLDEEKAADAKLSSLAKGEINEQAAAGAQFEKFPNEASRQSQREREPSRQRQSFDIRSEDSRR